MKKTNADDHPARYVDAYQAVVDAVGADPQGIGTGRRRLPESAQAKLVALARRKTADRYVEATKENVANRTYPRSAGLFASPYINNGPAIPANPLVVEFLRYVLQPRGPGPGVAGGRLPSTHRGGRPGVRPINCPELFRRATIGLAE